MKNVITVNMRRGIKAPKFYSSLAISIGLYTLRPVRYVGLVAQRYMVSIILMTQSIDDTFILIHKSTKNEHPAR